MLPVCLLGIRPELGIAADSGDVLDTHVRSPCGQQGLLCQVPRDDAWVCHPCDHPLSLQEWPRLALTTVCPGRRELPLSRPPGCTSVVGVSTGSASTKRHQKGSGAWLHGVRKGSLGLFSRLSEVRILVPRGRLHLSSHLSPRGRSSVRDASGTLPSRPLVPLQLRS